MFKWLAAFMIIIGVVVGHGPHGRPAHQQTVPSLLMALRQNGDYGVYRVDLGIDEPFELIPPRYDRVYYDGWSPDKAWLYVLVCSDQLEIPCGGFDHNYGETWRVAADGSRAERLPIPQSTGVTWSPDGQWMVFLGADGLYSANGDGTDLLNLTDDGGVQVLGGGSWATWRPVFSPDSRRVLFTAYNELEVALYWADLSGEDGICKITPRTGDGLWATAWPTQEWLIVNIGDRYWTDVRMRPDGSGMEWLSEWSDGGDIYASPLLTLPDGLIDLPEFLLVGNSNPYDNEDDTLNAVRLQDGVTLWTLPATTYLGETPDHWLLFLHDSGHSFKMQLDGSQLTPLVTIPPRLGPYVHYIDWQLYSDGGVFVYRNPETALSELYYLDSRDNTQPLTLLYSSPHNLEILAPTVEMDSMLIAEHLDVQLVIQQISIREGDVQQIAVFDGLDEFLAVAQPR